MKQRKYWAGSLIGILACAVVLSCGKKENGEPIAGEKKTTPLPAELEYRLIKAELKLAESKNPYLVLDFQRNEIELRLQGAVVWNFPIEPFDSTNIDLGNFAERFEGSDEKLVRPLMFKYLFSSDTRTPDSLLEIVSRVTLISPDLMQRTIPARFQLKWSEDITLDIRTDIVGKPASKWKNTIADIRQAIKRPFGDAYVSVRMPKENAITLFRATTIGMPTLIYPIS